MSSKKTEVVVKKFEELAFVNGSVSGSVDTAWGPVRIGVYARYLERWRHYFPLSQMLFVSGERLIVDPAAEMARVQVCCCKISCSFPPFGAWLVCRFESMRCLNNLCQHFFENSNGFHCEKTRRYFL